MHQDTNGRRRRRKHSPAYKAELVQLCLSSGASLAAIALDHGLNANLLHRWVIEHERLGLHTLDAASTDPAPVPAPAGALPEFIALGPPTSISLLMPASAHRHERAPTADATVRVFGAAHPHHAYVFANKRANRMKVLVHDGIGVWLVARRLNQGHFVWSNDGHGSVSLTHEQLDALVLGLPWQRIGEAGIIRLV